MVGAQKRKRRQVSFMWSGRTERGFRECYAASTLVARSCVRLFFGQVIDFARSLGQVDCPSSHGPSQDNDYVFSGDRLSFVSPHFGLHFSPASGSRQAPNHDRMASVGLCRLVSFVDYPSQVNIRATTAPRRRRSAEQPHGSFVTVKTQASSRPSGHRARVIFRVPPLLVFPCSARQAQHAHTVFPRMSDHGPPNPQFLSTSITKIDGSCSSSSDWRCAVAGRVL